MRSFWVKNHFFFGLLLFGFSFAVSAQDTSQLIIDQIFIEGNTKTRPNIILREMSLQADLEISANQLDSLILIDKQNIINTRLFLEVDIQALDAGANRKVILVSVVERWYLFPIPVFKLADRSFNEWWFNQGRDLSRVNYGLKLQHRNFRGRNERLQLLAQFGFTKKFGFWYVIPSINKKQNLGMILKMDYAERKNQAYNTEDHKLKFLRTEDELLSKSISGWLTLTHRYHFRNYHNFSLGYFSQSVADTILNLNPEFYLNGNDQRFFFLNYNFRRDFRNSVAYPLSGFFIQLEGEQKGLGVFDDLSLLRLTGTFAKYFDLGKDYYFSSGLILGNSYPKKQGFSNQPALGYGREYIRGYELNVIYGQDYFINKNTAKKKVLDVAINTPFPAKQFNKIPLALYVKGFVDLGYMRQKYPDILNDRLVNKLLIGAGIGIDIVTYYDSVFRVEYSINGEGQSGIYFNVKAEL